VPFRNGLNMENKGAKLIEKECTNEVYDELERLSRYKQKTKDKS